MKMSVTESWNPLIFGYELDKFPYSLMPMYTCVCYISICMLYIYIIRHMRIYVYMYYSYS